MANALDSLALNHRCNLFVNGKYHCTEFCIHGLSLSFLQNRELDTRWGNLSSQLPQIICKIFFRRVEVEIWNTTATISTQVISLILRQWYIPFRRWWSIKLFFFFNSNEARTRPRNYPNKEMEFEWFNLDKRSVIWIGFYCGRGSHMDEGWWITETLVDNTDDSDVFDVRRDAKIFAAAAADADEDAETNWKHKVTPHRGDLIIM